MLSMAQLHLSTTPSSPAAPHATRLQAMTGRLPMPPCSAIGFPFPPGWVPGRKRTPVGRMPMFTESCISQTAPVGPLSSLAARGHTTAKRAGWLIPPPWPWPQVLFAPWLAPQPINRRPGLLLMRGLLYCTVLYSPGTQFPRHIHTQWHNMLGCPGVSSISSLGHASPGARVHVRRNHLA